MDKENPCDPLLYLKIMHLIKADYLFCWLAFLSYFSLASSSAFNIRVSGKAAEFAKSDDLFNFGVRYHTFALLKTVHLKADLYKLIMNEIEIIFEGRNINNFDESRRMELDHLVSLTITSLIESSPDIIVAALNEALSINHPLNIYAKTSVFTREDILEDPINFDSFNEFRKKSRLYHDSFTRPSQSLLGPLQKFISIVDHPKYILSLSLRL